MLSNFSAHEVLYEGITYKTSEHAYQVAKFKNEAQRKNIASASSAFLARAYGQEPEGRTKDFDKVAVMKAIMRAKLEQHEDVQIALQGTGNQEIRKNHPLDYYWGTGEDGSGKNIMGIIWMELRDEFFSK